MILPFRDYTPQRRNITKIVTKYSYHRADLKMDFQDRCGYCNAHDSWRNSDYAIDHFIPQVKDKKPFLTLKTNTDYSNLVYSCRSCNNSKSNQWPTNNESVPNINDEGFIDPCDGLYNKQFGRKETGEITYTSKLGEWIYYALKMHKPQHQIIWNLEQLEPVVAEIKSLNNIVNIPEYLKDMIIQVLIKYDNYRDQLRK